MKKLFMRKTAGLFAAILLMSILLPVIAFAANASLNLIKYDSATNSATGIITVDKAVYDKEGKQLPLSVYAPNGTTALTTVYAAYDDVYGYYYLGTDNKLFTTYNTYSYLTFKYFYNGVINATYDVYNPNFSIGGGGGGGAPVASGTISVGADGKINAADLVAAFTAGNGAATLNLQGEFALLPASALLKGKTVTLVAGDVTYTLPIDALKLEELAKSLGVTVDQLTIRVDIKKLAGDAAAAVTAAVYGVGGKELAPATEFKVTAIAGDVTKEIKDFGTYVSRTFTLSETPASTANVVGALYDPSTKELSYVPTTVSTNGGKPVATLKRTGNSIYTVISVDNKSFSDLNGHWSKAEVEKLASNLIVNGVGANTFAPNRAITRAEFAAIVVRALGLTADGSTNKFSDVSANAWYAGDVAAAANAGLIKGYNDGTFKPNANITRQELASVVVRAMKYAGKDVTLTDAQVSSALASFADAKSLTWSKADVAAAVQAGVVKGQSATKIAPAATATRAEASAMVLRFLKDVGFIN